MRVLVKRAFWLAGRVQAAGEIIDTVEAVARELVAIGKAVPAPPEPPRRKRKAPDNDSD